MQLNITKINFTCFFLKILNVVTRKFLNDTWFTFYFPWTALVWRTYSPTLLEDGSLTSCLGVVKNLGVWALLRRLWTDPPACGSTTWCAPSLPLQGMAQDLLLRKASPPPSNCTDRKASAVRSSYSTVPKPYKHMYFLPLIPQHLHINQLNTRKLFGFLLEILSILYSEVAYNVHWR